MSEIEIITNSHWRNFVYRDEVPVNVLEQDFDYLNDEIDGFFKYRGRWYHISEFMRIDDRHTPMQNWHGYHSDSAFSGILVRLSDDCERYQVATYLSLG